MPWPTAAWSGRRSIGSFTFFGQLPAFGLRESPARALDDFRRARFLEPNAYQLPFEEGRAWLGWQPALALTAWREALQRRGAEEAGLYALMLADATNYDANVHAGLREFANNRPGLMINYLEAATRPQFEEALRDLRATDPELLQFTPRQKRRLFELWSSHDSLDEMLRVVQTHPEWLEFAWPGVARYHAGRGEFEEAWQLVRRYALPPTLPRSVAGRIHSGVGEGPLRSSWRLCGRLRAFPRASRLRQDGGCACHRPAFHCAAGCARLFSLSGSRNLGRKTRLGTRLAILAGLQTGEQGLERVRAYYRNRKWLPRTGLQFWIVCGKLLPRCLPATRNDPFR